MESLVLRLVDRGRSRAAIVLVERWSEFAEPTLAARVAEARAFLDLRMVDRAWLRLRDVVESSDASVEALAVAAELFLARGWPNQAKKLIQRGLERRADDPALQELLRKAQEPATTLDEDPSNADGASLADLIRVAEQYMVRGAFVRAQTLLERARRRQPDHARVDDLLWALAGEYGTPEPLELLIGRLEIAAGPAEEDPDEPEHTESARPEELRSPEPDASFPQLFRSLSADAETSEAEAAPTTIAEIAEESADFATSERTAITALSDLGIDATFGDKTDHGEDTQIARVMNRSGPVQEAIHSGNTRIETGFNLARYRRTMGMLHAEGLDLGGEEEDDSVIINTRTLQDETEEESSDRIVSLVSDADHEQLAKARQKKASDEEDWVRPPAPPPPDPPPEPVPAPQATPRPAPVRPRSAATDTVMIAWPYWVAAIWAVFALFALLFVVLSVVAAIT